MNAVGYAAPSPGSWATWAGGRLGAITAVRVVFGVWLAMFLAALAFVAVYASPIPFMDEIDTMMKIGRTDALTVQWLWSAHNEHRIPFTRLAYLGLVGPTRDLRTVMILDVVLLAFASLALILALRRWRGWTRATDVLLVPLFLSLGHCENMLSAFQISLVVPATILAGILALLVAAPRPRRSVAIVVGGLLVLLPMSGAAGLLTALPLAAWAFVEGLLGRRSTDVERRRAAQAWLVVAGCALVPCVLYFTFGGPLAIGKFPRESAARTISNALDLLSFGAGWMSPTELAIMRWAVLLALVATLTQVPAWVRRSSSDSWNRIGILACGLGTTILALGISRSRLGGGSSGIAPRYTTLFATFFAFLYVFWTMSAAGWLARIVRGWILIGIVAAIPAETSSALQYARQRKQAGDLLIADADAGMQPVDLAKKHWRSFFIREDGFAECLVHLKHLGFPPFRTPEIGPEEDPRTVRPFFLWDVTPLETTSDQPISRARVFGKSVVQVHAPARIVLAIPSGARGVRGEFGIPPVAYSNSKRATTELRFTILCEDEVTEGDILFLEDLDPVRNAADRGIRPFAVALPSVPCVRLLLRVEPTMPGENPMTWAFWTDLHFDS